MNAFFHENFVLLSVSIRPLNMRRFLYRPVVSTVVVIYIMYIIVQ